MPRLQSAPDLGVQLAAVVVEWGDSVGARGRQPRPSITDVSAGAQGAEVGGRAVSGLGGQRVQGLLLHRDRPRLLQGQAHTRCFSCSEHVSPRPRLQRVLLLEDTGSLSRASGDALTAVSWAAALGSMIAELPSEQEDLGGPCSDAVVEAHHRPRQRHRASPAIAPRTPRREAGFSHVWRRKGRERVRFRAGDLVRVRLFGA